MEMGISEVRNWLVAGRMRPAGKAEFAQSHACSKQILYVCRGIRSTPIQSIGKGSACEAPSAVRVFAMEG